MSEVIAAEVWGKRTVILAAFGLVGAGAVLGAGSVYFVYIKRRIEEHFALQSTITNEIHQLKEDVKLIKTSILVADSDLPKSGKPSKSSLKETRKSVKFANGYETAEEEQFVTASSESEDEPAVATRSKVSNR
jgi:hypothetical protein